MMWVYIIAGTFLALVLIGKIYASWCVKCPYCGSYRVFRIQDNYCDYFDDYWCSHCDNRWPVNDR